MVDHGTDVNAEFYKKLNQQIVQKDNFIRLLQIQIKNFKAAQEAAASREAMAGSEVAELEELKLENQQLKDRLELLENKDNIISGTDESAEIEELTNRLKSAEEARESASARADELARETQELRDRVEEMSKAETRGAGEDVGDERLDEVTKELEASRNRVKELEEMLAERENKLKELEKELKAVKENLDSTSEKLVATESSLHKAENMLQEAEEKLKQSDSRLQETEDKLKRSDSSLQEAEKRIGELQETESVEAGNGSAVDSKPAVSSVDNTAISEGSRDFEKLQAELEGARKQLEDMKAELQKARASKSAVDVLDTHDDQDDNILSALKDSLMKSVEEQQHRIRGLKQELSQARSRELELNDRIKELNAEIQMLEQKIERFNEKKQEELDKLQSRIHDMEEERDKVLESREQMQAEMDGMRSYLDKAEESEKALQKAEDQFRMKTLEHQREIDEIRRKYASFKSQLELLGNYALSLTKLE